MSVNPLLNQGLLNRAITHVVVPGNPQLTTFAPFMSKSMAVLTFDGPFVDQIPTATGLVNSPLIFVMGTLVVNLLRSQGLAGVWILQAQVDSMIGDVTTYSDSTTFPSIILNDCSITDFDPGAYDGTDPTVKVTVKGAYPVNAAIWSQAIATAASV